MRTAACVSIAITALQVLSVGCRDDDELDPMGDDDPSGDADTDGDTSGPFHINTCLICINGANLHSDFI